MGFSVVGASALLSVSLVLAVEIFIGGFLPVFTEVRESYDDMKDRMVDQIQTDVNITDISETSPWWNISFRYRKSFTIDNTKVNQTLSNFPVLVDVTDNNLKDRVSQSNGNDIAFISSDHTTKYNHEIELYNSANGNLVAWVNIPTVLGGSDTVFYIYYGNSTCSSQQSALATWNANYISVLHMKETGNANRADSTSNSEDFEADNFEGEEATDSGKIDGADNLDGSDDYLSSRGQYLEVLKGNTVTIEAWINATAITGPPFRPIVTQYNADWNGYYLFIKGGADGRPSFYLGCDSGLETVSANAINIAEWYHIVGTNNGNDLVIYVNGLLKKTEDSTGCTGVEQQAYIGYDSIDGYIFNGTIDEVRISDIARNSSWINTSYLNQNSPSTFYSTGNEESHLNITVKNTGNINHKTEDFNFLINGTIVTWSCTDSYLSPESETYFLITTAITTGEKRIKVITGNGISDYYKYNG